MRYLQTGRPSLSPPAPLESRPSATLIPRRQTRIDASRTIRLSQPSSIPPTTPPDALAGRPWPRTAAFRRSRQKRRVKPQDDRVGTSWWFFVPDERADRTRNGAVRPVNLGGPFPRRARKASWIGHGPQGIRIRSLGSEDKVGTAHGPLEGDRTRLRSLLLERGGPERGGSRATCRRASDPRSGDTRGSLSMHPVSWKAMKGTKGTWRDGEQEGDRWQKSNGVRSGAPETGGRSNV